MSDVAEMHAGLKDFKKLLRRTYGQPCPDCVRLLPKANPTILLPQQRCRIHGYRDQRPEREWVIHRRFRNPSAILRAVPELIEVRRKEQEAREASRAAWAAKLAAKEVTHA